MGFSRRTMILGSTAAGAGALVLAACGGEESGSGGGDDAAKVVFANNTEPEGLLIPTNIAEVGGGKVIGCLFSGLVHYKADGSLENELAESIESEDNQHWTITLKEGQKYSDGTVVTAQDFVDTWNFGANASNAQLGQNFFSPIEGYDELSAEGVDSAATLSGLAVTDERTFTVTLVSPQSDFPNRLGYYAFMPMPPSAFEDLDAYGEKPVSNGPYMLDTWLHDQEIVLVPNPEYAGVRAPKNAGITFIIYSQDETMYNDLTSGSLDIMDTIPNSALSSFEAELGDRAINEPGSSFSWLVLPFYDKNFEKGEAGNLRRQAISRAVDREEICSSLFYGTRAPATDYVSPVVPGGGRTDIPGSEVLQYDEALAKELWARAEAISPFEGPLTVAYNADGAHAEWIEAVCNSLRNTLGIEAVPTPYPVFGEMRTQVRDRTLEGSWRGGWKGNYPSAYDFLGPLYSTATADGKGSNDADYKNPEFDQLLADGLAAPSQGEAISLWQQAEELLMRDLPTVALWYQNTLGASSDLVTAAPFGWDGYPLYYAIEK